MIKVIVLISTLLISQIGLANAPQLPAELEELKMPCITQMGMIAEDEIGEETGVPWVFSKMNSDGSVVEAHVYMVIQDNEVRGLLQIELNTKEIKQIRTTTDGSPSPDEVVNICG